nr:MAG TPA: hypothetical protein [Caudoviricetes sp.]
MKKRKHFHNTAIGPHSVLRVCEQNGMGASYTHSPT